jgi:hypothetical protein
VKRGEFPGTYQFAFEMRLGINSALTMSSGELSTFVLDALFALDEQGTLFPGVTEPEDRLRMASMDAIAYERLRRSVPYGDAYDRLIKSIGRAARGKRELKEKLDEAVVKLGATMLRQRILMAQMQGLSDRCMYTDALKDVERTRAGTLIAATDAITAAVEASAKPVL